MELELTGEHGVVMNVNEHAQLDERVRESADLSAGIIGSAMDAIIAVDDAQRIVLFNSAAERIFACPANEAIGSSVERFIPERFRDGHSTRVRRFGESGVTNRTLNGLGTLWGLRANGEEFPIEASISKVESAGKKFFTAVIRDITERKQTEEALRESEERFRLAAQAGKMYAYEWNVATDVIVRSGDLSGVLGSTGEASLTRQQLLAKVHPDDRALFNASVSERTPEHPDVQISHRLLRPDGSVVWVEKTAHALFDEGGRMVRMIGMVADITERHRTEEAARESEQRFRLVADTAPALIWMSGTDKLCNYFNKPWLDFTGRSMEEELGNGWAQGVHPDDLQRCLDIYTQSFDRREKFKMEYRLRHHDGEYRWILDIGVPRFNQDGSFAGYIGICIDVTERKLVEDRLREYERAVEAAEEMIAVLDREYRIVMANRKYATMRNMQKEQIVGRFADDVLNEGVFEGVIKAKLDECFQGKVVRYEMKYTYPELGERDLSLSYFPIEGATGVEGAACIAQDITESKRLEEALRGMSRKLIEAQEHERARIARELHDDINQRLAMLAVELEQLKENPSEVGSRVQELRRQTTEISNDVQALSHDLHSSQVEYLGAVAGMKGWCKEFGDRQGMQIDCRHDVRSTLPTEIGLCLFRVLQEALHNAAKHSGVKRIEVQLREEPGEIHLIVSDSGRGFDVEAVKQGKGLGLTSMRERVRLVDGTFVIDSKSMGGTTIHVRVPLDSERASQRVAV
jgi:PAS domain S-box-containing protein